jgi:ketosteroid isomerase-like protein
MRLTDATQRPGGVVRMPASVTDEELRALVRRVTKAARALIAGDIRGYVALITHADDYTLMSPYGGEPVCGFDESDAAIEGLEQFFRGGRADVEVVETYASGDLVVLVVIERQYGTVGDLPEQDWSLRVTWVFRRGGSDWELVHRHADALVHPIDHGRLGELARGE